MGIEDKVNLLTVLELCVGIPAALWIVLPVQTYLGRLRRGGEVDAAVHLKVASRLRLLYPTVGLMATIALAAAPLLTVGRWSNWFWVWTVVTLLVAEFAAALVIRLIMSHVTKAETESR